MLETYGGSFGPSERAVVPVRADGGPVLALVSVGVTRDAVARELAQQVPTLLVAAIAALLLAAGGAALVARRLRRQTHGMGPDELARMYEFYDAVLHAVREGLVLLDLDGRLLLANDEARRLLDLPADWAGRRLDELGLPAPMTEALDGGREVDDAIHLTAEPGAGGQPGAGPLGGARARHRPDAARPHRSAGTDRRAGLGPRPGRGAALTGPRGGQPAAQRDQPDRAGTHRPGADLRHGRARPGPAAHRPGRRRRRRAGAGRAAAGQGRRGQRARASRSRSTRPAPSPRA